MTDTPKPPPPGSEPLDSDLGSFMPAFEQLAEAVRSAHDDGFGVAKKLSMFVPVSNETMMAYGLIPDTRPPVHIPWHRRLRWRVRDTIDRARLKVGARIAGVDVRDWEDLT